MVQYKRVAPAAALATVLAFAASRAITVSEGAKALPGAFVGTRLTVWSVVRPRWPRVHAPARSPSHAPPAPEPARVKRAKRTASVTNCVKHYCLWCAKLPIYL